MENKEKYSFNKYTPEYKKLFLIEKRKLKKLLPYAAIEHVGSTAVFLLSGKGIIDILVSVPKNKIKLSLEKLKKYYVQPKKGGDSDRIFLQRIIKYQGKERRVHIHLTFKRSLTEKSMIAIRDYLSQHSDIRKEYEKIKKVAVKYSKGEGKKYRKYKEKFLKKIEKKALT